MFVFYPIGGRIVVDMLTDNDLKKIGQVVDEKIEKRLKPIKDDMASLGQVVDEKIEKRLKPIKDDIAQIRKDMKTLVNFFDREYLELRKRVERIEAHLKISVS